MKRRITNNRLQCDLVSIWMIGIAVTSLACKADGVPFALPQAESSSAMEAGDLDAPGNSSVNYSIAAQRRMREIDRRFPVPSIPEQDPALFRVLGIDDSGKLSLDDGRNVVLDGIECSQSGIGYLRRMLTFDGVSIAFIDEPKLNVQPIAANIWLIERLEIVGQPKLTYMRIAETALSSGWCLPRPTSTSKYDARYAAIAELVRNSPSQRN
jgi:hypothetical protein